MTGIASDSRADVALDDFFTSLQRLKPVTASFSGVTVFDHQLPDYSPEGLKAARGEMTRLRRVLADAGLGVLVPSDLAPPDWNAIDGALADAVLELQLAENDSPHFVRGNPALAIAEALFSLVVLAGRVAQPVEPRVEAAVDRLRAFPGFLHGARRTLGEGPVPEAWRDRAVRDCSAGLDLLADLAGWPVVEKAPVSLCRALQDAATHAAAAVDWYRAYVAERPPAETSRYAAGSGLLDVTLRRAYWCDRTVSRLRHEARAALEREQFRFQEVLRDSGSTWKEISEHLSSPLDEASDVLDTCRSAWEQARALTMDQVTWPDRSLDFVALPGWARRAARGLSWRLYRSPPPFLPDEPDQYAIPLPDDSDDAGTRETFARIWSRGSVRVLHAVYHGGLGRHVQYFHAGRSPSRVGRLAAVDGALRMAMPVGGTLAEGWAAYAAEVTEDLGFFTREERVAAERERVHIMVRAVVDLELHVGLMSFDDAMALHRDVAFVSEGTARTEVTRCSMFPGSGVMRWLGLRGIWQARHEAESSEGSAFNPRTFHDALLAGGSVPVPLGARILSASRQG